MLDGDYSGWRNDGTAGYYPAAFKSRLGTGAKLEFVWPVASTNNVKRTMEMPLGVLSPSDNVAYGPSYLASDASSWITGVELMINGFISAQQEVPAFSPRPG